MRQQLAPLLFDDTEPAVAAAQRSSPVAKARPSPAAKRKTDAGRPAGDECSLACKIAHKFPHFMIFESRSCILHDRADIDSASR